METNNKLGILRAFEKDAELMERFARNKASLEDISQLAETAKLYPNFIAVNLKEVVRLANSPKT